MIRKHYPYLADSYIETEQQGKERLNFLSTIDNFVNQKQYVRITLLNWNEEPLKEIQGELTSGSIAKDGSSAIRRTCQLGATIGRGEYDVENSEMDFAINKKIFLEIGVKNYSNQYKEYPILWFPQGVFFISSFNMTSNAAASISINLTLKDKMCGLNGEVGGKFPAAMVLDEVDTQSPSGKYISQKIKIYDIIQELVHHYGGEPITNIVIEDVPLRVKKIMRWMGKKPIYMRPEKSDSGYTWYEVLTEKPQDMSGVKEYPQNSDVGYTYTDFVYTNELTANIGESVASVLDKIKQFLGNYEYFYDEFGVFHFREIKNYLNKTQATTVLEDMKANDYLIDIFHGKANYSFSDKTNLISITQTPSYENIKNDYVIQGKRKGTDSKAAIFIRYHLAIDNKPQTGNKYEDLLLYTEPDTKLIKAAFPLTVKTEKDLPIPGNFNIIYRDASANTFYYWEDSTYKEVAKVEYYTATNPYITKDWRTELYLQGLLAQNKGTDAGQYYNKLEQNFGQTDNLDSKDYLNQIYQQSQRARIDTDYYFEELEAFWPQVYDLKEQKFFGQKENTELYTFSLTDGNYYLDFIEPNTSGLGQYSINNIGRRTQAVANDNVNCLFTPEIPDIIFLNVDSDNIEEQREECNRNGQPYSQVKGDIFNSLFVGGYKNGAFDQIKYELYVHTNYQKNVSVTSIPAFYLEPNTLVSMQDSSTNLKGNFLIKTINIPFGPGQAMTTTMTEALERF